MHIEPIPRPVVLGALTAAILIANLRGGLDARIVAAVLTLYVVIDFADIHEPLTGAPVTAAGFAVCLWVALRSRRHWTIWAAAAQLLSVVTDVLRVIVPLADWPYYSAQVAWAFVTIAILIWGALTDRDAPATRL